jgi:catechol 2,3-dioxygenase-like lactoylglutathione lyase family enzyme
MRSYVRRTVTGRRAVAAARAVNPNSTFDQEGKMSTVMRTPLAQRLHHTAYVTKDQEATRAFYEDILGFPLLATWSEADELFGALRVYCHTFFGLADGSALAFFQFADEADQQLFDPELVPSPFRHVALKVDADAQAELERRLREANWKPEGTYVLEHGYCRSLYTEDPNGMLLEFTVDVPEADRIAEIRQQDAHETLRRWLAGDHTGNNMYR